MYFNRTHDKYIVTIRHHFFKNEYFFSLHEKLNKDLKYIIMEKLKYVINKKR
jgi:hypothetical protein